MNRFELDDMLTRWMAGELPAEGFARLESLLTEHPDARWRLRQHMILDEVLREAGADLPGEPSLPKPVIPMFNSWGNSWGFTSSTLFILLLLFTACGIWWWQEARQTPQNEPPQLVAKAPNKSPNDKSAQSGGQSRVVGGSHLPSPVGRAPQPNATLRHASSYVNPYVARIVKTSTDCAWAEMTMPSEFLLRVRAGDRMQLAAGLAELEFLDGARIILHGPAVFIPTGSAAGHLESGRLTGEVSNGNFRLMTPAAEVIDLGTAFGVVADGDVGTDVVVFDGRVQVVSKPQANDGKTILDMTEGMSARFRFDGSTEYGMIAEAANFARKIAATVEAKDNNVVCLIDVISGGNGTEGGLAGAVDTSTGNQDYGEQGMKLQAGARTSEQFNTVPWHSMIDGVFVPTADGTSVQLDSDGHKVKLPATRGFAYGSIWARRAQSAMQPDGEQNNDFWGARTLRGIVERLKRTERGLIGIHANAGITFDLQAITKVHGRRPIEFRGGVANIENSADWTPEEMPEFRRTVNLHLYVDGKLRFERLGFRLEDGEAKMELALLPDDRFLTIITTDDGNLEFDHVALIDPVIALATE